jgi:predicted nucleotidyltransferase
VTGVRLADALFSRVQQRVLGILFGQPDRSFLSNEVIQLANSGTGAVHRELKRLDASGLVTVRTVGRQKHYQANKESPVFEELHGLVVKTIGLVEPLRQALAPMADRIQAAFVYGSQAKGTDTVASDVDVMIVSDDLSYADAYAVLARAEATLARPVNPTILTPAEWREKRREGKHFVDTVAIQPKLFVVGSEDDLG